MLQTTSRVTASVRKTIKNEADRTKNVSLDIFSKKLKKYQKKHLTFILLGDILSNVPSGMREWRNRQTRTFEGRVVIPYGFKSRLSHQNR